jgi:hypothetical protein
LAIFSIFSWIWWWLLKMLKMAENAGRLLIIFKRLSS